MKRLKLSLEQLRFVRTFGYLHLPGLVRDRFAEIERGFNALIAEFGGDS